VESGGGRKRRKGRSVRRQYDGEIIHGRESSCRELTTILGSVVVPGAATSTSAQISRDQQCGRGKETGGRKQQVECGGGRKRRKGRNVRRQYDGEIIHGRESSCRELAMILGSVVDPGAAASTPAQVSRDRQCGRGKGTRAGNLRWRKSVTGFLNSRYLGI
jgi:hypothetical protein